MSNSEGRIHHQLLLPIQSRQQFCECSTMWTIYGVRKSVTSRLVRVHSATS